MFFFTCDSLMTMGKKVSSLPPICSHSVPLVIRKPSRQELQSRAAAKEALGGSTLVKGTKKLEMCSVPSAGELICEYVEGGGFD